MFGYYINLEHRTDRRQHIESMKQRKHFFKNVQRMEAIRNMRGDVGCALSHIKCLNELSKRNEDYYLIMEDDFCILSEENFDNFVEHFENIKNDNDWDVITCTPRGNTTTYNYKKGFNRIVNNQTATCYIIKHTFIDTLLPIFKNGVNNLMQNKDPNYCALDQCWKPLQIEHSFIYFEKIFGGQLPGYSDIEKKQVNYNQRFSEQSKY